MTVDSRLDDLEQFQRNAQNRLRRLEDGQTAILQRLDQIVAGQFEILAEVQGLRSGCVALQDAMNLYRLQVRRTFRGEGNGV